MSETAAVEAYAGGSYPGHPRAVTWRGRRYTVEAVLRRWRTPEGLFFNVQCHSGPRLTLHYEETSDTWRAFRTELQDGRDSRSPSLEFLSVHQENPG